MQLRRFVRPPRQTDTNLVLVLGVLGAAPGHVAHSVRGHDLAGQQRTLVASAADEQRLAAQVLAAGHGVGGDLASSRVHPRRHAAGASVTGLYPARGGSRGRLWRKKNEEPGLESDK